MNALLLLMTVFVVSFLIAFTISYFIVQNDEKLKYGRLHDKHISLSLFLSRIKLALLNFVILSAITAISLYILGDQSFNFTKISIWKFIFHFLVMIAIDDIWFYGIHRLLHRNKFLYKKIHSIHHRAVPPIPIDYLFVHPLEALAGSVGIMIGLVILILLDGNISIYVFTAYSLYRALHEVAIHSGFQLIPKKYLGVLGSTNHHFNHHKYHNGNFASSFTYLDKIFGTEVKVRDKVID
jgi:sterol desaturase/sphingolipid hydroxylase (fatty acid hydroxylase superfamily)